MIIRWNRNIRSTLYILAAVFLLLSAVYMVRDYSGEMINANSQAPTQNELDDSINKLLSDQESSNFFAEYRMERERVRSKQVETLKDVINKESVSQEARDAAALRLVKISEDIEKEMKAESLIKSEGYEDCAVIIQAETTTVVILTAALRLDQEEEIKKMVSRSVPCSEESICIIAREK